MKLEKSKLVNIVNWSFFIFGGLLIFFVPSYCRYLNIINWLDYYILSYITAFSFNVLLRKIIKKSPDFKKALFSLGITIFIYCIIGTYFHLHLPKYKYEDAVNVIKKEVIQKNPKLEILIPKNKFYKINRLEHKYLRISNYTYLIYLSYKEEKFVYIFYPLDGTYEKTNINLDEKNIEFLK